MAETQPRNLTAAELEGLKAPPLISADSAPLAVPPGTDLPVHLVDPTASRAASTQAPTQLPPGKTSS